MELTIIALNKILIMFIIIVIGIICSKTGIIDEVGNKKITNLVLMLVNALVIFMSYQVNFDIKLLWGLVFTLLLTILSFIISIIIAHLIIRKNNNEDYPIERLSLIYSNCGFIGIPLINALLGATGVFYLAVYLTVFNTLLWTHGYIQMTGKCSFREFLRLLRSPCLVAVFLGIICFLLQIKLLPQISEAFDSIASTNTPLAMLCAGATIAKADIFGSLKKLRTYILCFLKLIFIPIITVLMLAFIPVDSIIKMTIIIAAACPAGASCTQFALRFDKNAAYASELFGITTVLCVISVPLVIMFAQLTIL